MPQRVNATVATRLPQAQCDEFEEALKRSPYLKPAMFLRAAMAEEIRKMGAEH